MRIQVGRGFTRHYDNTYESIGKPLLNRKNYVLSRDTSLSIDGVTVIHDISQIPDDSFVIGGESIYKILLKNLDGN